MLIVMTWELHHFSLIKFCDVNNHSELYNSLHLSFSLNILSEMTVYSAVGRGVASHIGHMLSGLFLCQLINLIRSKMKLPVVWYSV